MSTAEISFTAAYSDADRAKTLQIVHWLGADPARTGAELSRSADIKDGTRSSILNGSYPSSPTKFLDNLLAAIERSTARHDAKVDIPYTETSIAKLIAKVCHRAHLDKDFGIFVGRVGVGKTCALRQYCKTNNNAVLVECFEGIDHGVFIAELTVAMGVPVTTGSISLQTARLINNLKSSDRVLLIDEANHLSSRSLGALRRLSDVGQIGVVLVGTPELSLMVQDDHGRFGQISSRIGFWPPIAMVIKEEDAAALAMRYFGETLSDEVLKAFYACCEGSARTLRNLLRNVWRKSIQYKIAISAELIHKASQEAMAGRHMKAKG